MKNKMKRLIKNKRFLIFLVLFVVLLVCVFFLRGVFFPGGGSKYGNRLDGIKKISFTEKDQKSVIDSINADDRASGAKLDIQGKLINVIFNVNKDTSVDDAKAIAQASLEKFSQEVKGFYDIQYMIANPEEVGEEVQITNQDGSTTKEIKKKFPIMGYKNSNRDGIVW